MGRYLFDKVSVIGSGKIAFLCADYCMNKFNIRTELFETSLKQSSFLKKNCDSAHIDYYCIDKDSLEKKLLEQKARQLILSVFNPYILSSSLINKDNVMMINLHHGLLPYHMGRYAEAWAIYEQDEYSGITWHILTEAVDKGDILIQKKIRLTDNLTSVMLLNKLNNLAYSAFCEIVDSIMDGSYKTFPQKKIQKHTFHFSTDSPNNGILDIKWEGRKISAFLRAYDYRVNSPFCEPYLFHDGKKYQWNKYRIVSIQNAVEKIIIKNDIITIKKKDIDIILSGIREVPIENV